MLFFKIKTFLSAKHLFALKRERIRTHILKQPSSLYCGRCTMLPSLTPSCPERRGLGSSFTPAGPLLGLDPPTPRHEKPPPCWDHPHQGEHEKDFTNSLGSMPCFLPEDVQVGNLNLRINRSPLVLLSGSQWRILSAELPWQQFFKAFFCVFFKYKSNFIWTHPNYPIRLSCEVFLE